MPRTRNLSKELIYDRVQADLDYVKSLIAKGTDSMTPEEKAEWDSCTLKGSYNYTDLNRVNEAMVYLASLFNEVGYAVTLTTLRQFKAPDYSNQTFDYPSITEMNTYLSNLTKLRAVLPAMVTTPAAPSTMQKLTLDKANQIEKILVDIDILITGMYAAFHHSGSTICGMGGLVV